MAIQTTLYVADVDSFNLSSHADLKNAIWKQMKDRFSDGSIKFVENTVKRGKREFEYKKILYGDTEIYITLRQVGYPKKLLLTFFLVGRDAKRWGKDINKKKATSALNFCSSVIGNDVEFSDGNNKLLFKKIDVDDSSVIDISQWVLDINYREPPETVNYKDYFSNAHREYRKIMDGFKKKGLRFCVYAPPEERDKKFVKKVEKFLSDFGKVHSCRPHTMSQDDYTSMDESRREGTLYIFTGRSRFKYTYVKIKLFFDEKEFPTQFVMEETMNKITRPFLGVCANIILEMTHKIEERTPIELKIPQNVNVGDGFLCISDVKVEEKNMLGALFTVSRGGNTKEVIQIYKDVEYQLRKEDDKKKISMTDDNARVLAEKISVLIGKKVTVDVILTRQWKEENLKSFIKFAYKNGVEISNIYYISSKTARFIDSSIFDEANISKHIFHKVTDKVVFLRTSSQLRIFPNLSQLFIEKVYPFDGKIEEGDLQKILWLVKKRTYRIQEYGVVKLPEPLKIFDNVRKLALDKGDTAKREIKLKYLI